MALPVLMAPMARRYQRRMGSLAAILLAFLRIRTGGGTAGTGGGGSGGTGGSGGSGGSTVDDSDGGVNPDAGDAGGGEELSQNEQIATDICAKFAQVDAVECPPAPGCVDGLVANMEFFSTGDFAECEDETVAYFQCQAGAPLDEYECSGEDPNTPQYAVGSDTCADEEEEFFSTVFADPALCAD